MKILALDLGIRKSVACVHETDDAGSRFVAVATTVESMEELFEETRLDRVVMEVGPITGGCTTLPYGLASKRYRLREPAVRRGSGRTSESSR